MTGTTAACTTASVWQPIGDGFTPSRVDGLVHRQRVTWWSSTALLAFVALGVALRSAWTLADEVHATDLEALIPAFTFIVVAVPALLCISVATSSPVRQGCCFFCVLAVPLHDLWQALAALSEKPCTAEIVTVRPTRLDLCPIPTGTRVFLLCAPPPCTESLLARCSRRGRLCA